MSTSTSANPCRRFTFAEIQSATEDFHDKLCIGEGGFGKVYKGQIVSEGQGVVVAIKRLDSTSNQGESEFRTEIEMLSKLRHCHLVSLIGYCEVNKEMILVYEYMRHGTLYHRLHQAETPLSWVQRMNIAIGAGRGLDYLHTGVGTHHGIIHRDVKTSNILLDENLAALISDFGLSRIGPTNQSLSFVDASVKGTFGYLDPEYFYTRRLTRKTDVYAFGVVLFELLSGRLPVDIRYGEDQCSLVRWAQKCLAERKFDQMVDSKIKGTIFPKCLRRFAQIAGHCLHSDPSKRPTMTEVVASLQALWQLQIKSASSSGPSRFTWKIHKYLVSETKQISDKAEYIVATNHPAMGSIPKATEAEQVAAGWPTWLAAVAGEAIQGWVPRRADSFEKLDKIGQGTYSNVYRARDLDQGKIVALKKVRFDHQKPESVRFMAREIHILRKLDHPNVIKLEGLVTSRMSCSLYLVFEYMEHDLAGLASHPTLKFTESQVKCYIRQLLHGLGHCHSRGILHRDIKGSNLLVDNNGILKIADFGSASFFYPRQSQPLTSHVVTLWYRPPEFFLGATYYGTAVDLWSTGCIVAELYSGKPIMPGRTEAEQMHKIFKLCGSPSEDYWRKSNLPHASIFKPQQPYKRVVAETFKEFPAPALALTETLLSIDPPDRGSAASALKSEFFSTKPFPCDPSSLPKYPPSKEFDAKLRDEEARRQAAAGGKVYRPDAERRGTRESRAVPAPEANAELVSSLQKRQGQSYSRSEKFNPQHEESASGFPIDPPRPSQAMEEDKTNNLHERASHSGPLVQRAAWSKSGKKTESNGADLSAMLGLAAAVAATKSMLYESLRDRDTSGTSQQLPRLISRFPGSLKEVSSTAAGQPDDDGRPGNKDPINLGYGSKASKIHYSGPLLAPSGKVDQMLKDHDRQIQEAVRRARFKTKVRKVKAENTLYSGR